MGATIRFHRLCVSVYTSLDTKKDSSNNKFDRKDTSVNCHHSHGKERKEKRKRCDHHHLHLHCKYIKDANELVGISYN